MRICSPAGTKPVAVTSNDSSVVGACPSSSREPSRTACWRSEWRWAAVSMKASLATRSWW